ncbi:SDR family oxidoreductase [Parasphingorhabdus sp. DH2-15]|uniref:SDR family oxidoreductase n=1 Tax=Parasphingorhabdus sp. DH2-15 TaxID=3444112 RepID=UPI003F683713
MTSRRHDAVVIGTGGAIGSSLADSLEESGDYNRVFRLSRHSSDDHFIDISDEQSIADCAQFVADKNASPNLILCATGILHQQDKQPEKSLRELDSEWLARVYQVNAIGPAMVAKHFIPLMSRKDRAIFAALGARVGSISDNHLGGWYGYRASKAALHMFIRNIAIEWARKNPEALAIAIHPGTVDSSLSEPFQRSVPNNKLFTPAYSAEKMLRVINRLGPEQSGKVFAWDGQEIIP